MMEKRGVIDDNTPTPKRCRPDCCAGDCAKPATTKQAAQADDAYLPDELAQRFAQSPVPRNPSRPQS